MHVYFEKFAYSYQLTQNKVKQISYIQLMNSYLLFL